MATDRNQLEQEALALLNRGQVDKALGRYQALLKADPRDRRVRQKVAELLLRMGRRGEGERLLREVADGLIADGQHRAALAVLKQLQELSPDDADLEGQLGVCYGAAGFPTEARRALESAVKRLGRADPAKAVIYARQLARLAAGELPLQVQLAELLEAAGQRAEALEAWRALAADSKRRGRSDDYARFLEFALRSASDDVDLLCEAAEARFALGDPRAALVHVQKAHQVEKQSPRVLGLLARALEEGGQAAKARPLWVQAARLFEAEGNATARAEALTRALACGPDDAELRAMLGDASQAAARAQLRLDDKAWALPRNEAETRLVIRARTLSRYGKAEAARAALQEATGALRASLPVRVALGELLVELGDTPGALVELRAVSAPADAEARDQLQTRIEVLSGERLSEADLSELAPEALEDLDDGISVSAHPSHPQDDEIIDDEPTQDTNPPLKASPPTPPPAPAKGLGLRVAVKKAKAKEAEPAPPPRPPPPPEAPRTLEPRTVTDFPASAAVAEVDPFVDGDTASDPYALRHGDDEATGVASGGFDSFLDGSESAFVDPDEDSPFVPAPTFLEGGSGPDFSGLLGVSGPALAEEIEAENTVPEVTEADPVLADARALVAVGMFAEAQRRVSARTDLRAQVVMVRALWGAGDVGGASERMRSAVSEVSENTPGYPDALWILAQLDAVTRKTRSALRLLAELEDLRPDYRADEVADLRRGIELMQKK